MDTTDKPAGSSFPSITPETGNDKEALLQFIPLAEMVARKELSQASQYGSEFRELVNIGLIKINNLIREAADKRQTYNPSYIAQGIVWEIRNKNRREAHQRGDYKTYTSSSIDEESGGGFTLSDIREAVIETVASYDDSSFEIADENAIDPAEAAELTEINTALREAVLLLPDNYREVIELRFYRGMKGIDIAERLGVSSARVTRIIQDALETIKKRLSEKKLL
ncbi:MAG: sigma-70 family RNA polymerase sigma factor [Candidatus Caenarcaniphilales bacterium]|nr:sigma-70 family RNA polymerase sigma factor [Candidatus Caenarcaniphilales bacterium]